MRSFFSQVASALALLAVYSTSYAGGTVPVPEPGVLELAGLGAAVALAVSVYKRRKK